MVLPPGKTKDKRESGDRLQERFKEDYGKGLGHSLLAKNFPWSLRMFVADIQGLNWLVGGETEPGPPAHVYWVKVLQARGGRKRKKNITKRSIIMNQGITERGGSQYHQTLVGRQMTRRAPAERTRYRDKCCLKRWI